MPVARILGFHDVTHSQMQCLREKLEMLEKMANVVSLDDIVAGRISVRKLNIALTFDDGYRGWLDNVCPVLKGLGMSATFFVSSGLVGLRDEEERDFLRNNLRSTRPTTGTLSAKELKTLAEEGFAIGGHTRNHVNLAEIFDVNRLRCEIETDKKEIERITGTSVRFFAYPFGACNNSRIDLARILHESGYQGAVTLAPGLIIASTNSYFLHRDLVNASMPMSVFKARLLGNYDGVMSIRRVLQL
jgi:peptidoglycan/xylan/chitin deacetylase (PgdA/CDA1 family)